MTALARLSLCVLIPIVVGVGVSPGALSAEEAALAVPASAPAADASPTEQDAPRLEAGRRMYMEGRLPSGDLMSGTVVGDVKLSGDQVICAACHRRSGLGSMEGQEVVPAVTGDLLFQPLRLPTSKPPLAPMLRPAYDEQLLKRAIRDGLRADGRPLGELMPRYDLTDEQLDTLIVYLKALESSPAPGVTDRDMHFATVIAGPVDPATRKAFVDVLEAYFEQKNKETRHESYRATNAPWHKAWLMAPYRKWVLHRWEIEGPSESWQQQLQAKYQEQPVFAVISGLATGNWKPIHEFCEDNRLPCIFPNTDLPVIKESDFYSIYFTRGMALEADAVAQQLLVDDQIGGPVVQVFRSDDPRALAAADRLRQQVLSLGGRQVIDLPLAHAAGEAPVVESELQTVLQQAQGGTAVLWLTGADLDGFWADWMSSADGGPERVYLSTTLYGTQPRTLPAELRQRVYLVHPSALPSRLPRLLARSSGWMKPKGIDAPDSRPVQANAFFALKAAGESVKGIRGFFNRELFLERIEHMSENATYTSIYPAVSLAPRQRFVSRGVYITQFQPDGDAGLVALTDWFVPGSN